MDKFEIVLGYSDIFVGSPPSDSFEYLKIYSTKQILIKIAHINAILFNQPTDSDIKVFQEVLFGNNKIPVQLITAIQQQLGQGTFFCAPSLSLLIKHSLNHFQGEQAKDTPYIDFAIDLFKTILLFNKEYTGILRDNDNLTSFKNIFTFDAIQQSYIRSTRMFTYIIKSAFMCTFLSQDKNLRRYAIDFCERYGMSDPWKISKFLINLFQDNTTGTAKYGLSRRAIPENLLNDWIINRDIIHNENGITLNLHILPKPLFVINDEEIIVLDLAFFQYIINQGFFFNIYKKSIAEGPIDRRHYNNFKSYIGKEYFEKYLCSTVLRRLFNKRHQIVISNEKYQDFIIKSSSDNLLVIEVKMTDVHASTIENIDFESYKQTIDKNFLSKKVAGKKSKGAKGAYQLINQIKQLSNIDNENEVCKTFKIKKLKNLNIYPIILTSDTNYDLMGTNNYIIEQTENELQELATHFKSVKPILILNINTLIEHFPYLQNNKNKLTDLIKAYFSVIHRWKKSFGINQDIYSYYKSSKSFEEYVKNKLRDYTIIKDFDVFVQNFEEELSSMDFSRDSSVIN